MEVVSPAGTVQGRRSYSWLNLGVKRIAFFRDNLARVQNIDPLSLDIVCGILSELVWLHDPCVIVISSCLNLSLGRCEHLVLVLINVLGFGHVSAVFIVTEQHWSGRGWLVS